METSFLPPAFELIPRLLVLLDDPDVNSDALADVIRIDPGLTADVLHTANAACTAGSARVDTLRDALVRLGLHEVYRILMRVLASPVLVGSHNPVLHRLDLWKHSLAAALAAQLLSRQCGFHDTEVAFTAALLHDLGKVMFAHKFGEQYAAVVHESKSQSKALFLLERTAFGDDHARAGATLLEKWNFPERILEAIRHHHEPLAAPQPAPAALVYTANLLAYRIEQGYGFPPYVTGPDPAVLQVLNLTVNHLSEFEQEVKQAVEKERARYR